MTALLAGFLRGVRDVIGLALIFFGLLMLLAFFGGH
jgi:hypothetical protein